MKHLVLLRSVNIFNIKLTPTTIYLSYRDNFTYTKYRRGTLDLFKFLIAQIKRTSDLRFKIRTTQNSPGCCITAWDARKQALLFFYGSGATRFSP